MEYYSRKMSHKITCRIKCMIDPVGGDDDDICEDDR